jgi:hypothetical protein
VPGRLHADQFRVELYAVQMRHGGLVRKASSVRKGKGPTFNNTLRAIPMVKNLQVVDQTGRLVFRRPLDVIDDKKYQ